MTQRNHTRIRDPSAHREIDVGQLRTMLTICLQSTLLICLEPSPKPLLFCQQCPTNWWASLFVDTNGPIVQGTRKSMTAVRIPSIFSRQSRDCASGGVSVVPRCRRGRGRASLVVSALWPRQARVSFAAGSTACGSSDPWTVPHTPFTWGGSVHVGGERRIEENSRRRMAMALPALIRCSAAGTPMQTQRAYLSKSNVHKSTRHTMYVPCTINLLFFT